MTVRPRDAMRLLGDPLINRGTAFSEAERTRLGLRGLLPSAVETLDQQVARAYAAFGEQPTDIAKHINLRALQDTNEIVFYELLSEHIEEMLPIVYTPTVGIAAQRFSEIYRRPRGLFISYPDRDRIGEALRNRPHDEVDIIVVTDGQRVLGLGDQGNGGMGIPIGKLSLYSALGGIDPARTLPIMLDVGTDNAELLDDPVYLGWRHRRVEGDEYDEFIDEFVEAVMDELPGVLLHWEDFSTPHALPILARFRDRLLTFNDDIQGTAAVVLGALSAAATATGSRIRDQTVVMLGAGSAGAGVSEQIVRAMITDGLSDAEARARVYVVDVNGLLTSDRRDLSEAQRRLAQPPTAVAAADPGSAPRLRDVVAAVQPTALLGFSTAAGAFTEEVVRIDGRARPAADHHAAVESDQSQRGAPAGSGRLDAGASTDRDRIAVPADADRRRAGPGGPMQQRVRVPRHRPRGDGGRRDPDHRRDADRRGDCGWRRRADPRRSARGPAAGAVKTRRHGDDGRPSGCARRGRRRGRARAQRRGGRRCDRVDPLDAGLRAADPGPRAGVNAARLTPASRLARRRPAPLRRPHGRGLVTVHPDLPPTRARPFRVVEAIRPAPGELGLAQVKDAAENRCDPPPRPADLVLDLGERSRAVRCVRQGLEQRSHQLTAAVVKALDLVGVGHRIVGRMLVKRRRSAAALHHVAGIAKANIRCASIRA